MDANIGETNSLLECVFLRAYETQLDRVGELSRSSWDWPEARPVSAIAPSQASPAVGKAH